MIVLNEQATGLATVGRVSAIGQGWYLVATDSGRSVRAESVTAWRIGDRVTVINGQIVGRAGARILTKIYEV